jgi:hypothetical protein
MGLAIVAAMSLWLGYWSLLAQAAASKGPVAYLRLKYFEPVVRMKGWGLPALVAVSLLCRLVQVQLGVFGYSAEYDRLIELGSVTQYLAMGASFGKLALVVATIDYYSPQRGIRTERWFVAILAYEMGFGFLSGFKSAVVMPIIIIALCQYLRLGRVSKIWLIAAPIALAMAYAVIEPFRVALNQDLGFKGTSISTILDTMSSTSGPAASDDSSLALSVMGRMNMTYSASVGISFADSAETMPEGSPDFLGDLLLAPVHAWVPRFIWADKALGNIGLWYTQVVMGNDIMSSTAMGPFTYLYFAGGTIAVVLGFLFLGVMQRLLVVLTNPTISASGAMVYLGMLSAVVLVDTAFNSIIITICRELPLLLIMQAVFFKPVAEERSAFRDPFHRRGPRDRMATRGHST